MSHEQRATTQEQTVQQTLPQTTRTTGTAEAPTDPGTGQHDPDPAVHPGPEAARDRSRAAPQTAEPAPPPGSVEVEPAAGPAAGEGRSEKTQLVARVTEQRLRRIGVWSTTAVAAVVGVLTAMLVFLAGVGVWLLASESGLVTRGEDLVSAVTTDGTFALDSESLLAGWAFLAGLWAVTLTALGFVLAVIVNTACALTGGIRLKLVSKPSRRTRRRRAQLAAAPGASAAARTDGDESRSAAPDPDASARAEPTPGAPAAPEARPLQAEDAGDLSEDDRAVDAPTAAGDLSEVDLRPDPEPGGSTGAREPVSSSR